MSQPLELPDAIYRALLEAARAEGVTPTTWIADKLPKSPSAPSAEERRAAHARLRGLTVSLGHATGIENEGIDADLEREYGDDHSSPDARA
jgi:hypothetical protein